MPVPQPAGYRAVIVLQAGAIAVLLVLIFVGLVALVTLVRDRP